MLQRSLISWVLICATLAAVGCSNTRTYKTKDDRLAGRPLVSKVLLDVETGTLEATTDADQTPIRKVTLHTATGDRLEPFVSTYEPAERRGGLGLGIGIGTGVGSNVGVGVGTGTHVGGRIVPGPLYTRWQNPPLDQQPFHLLVTLDTRPPFTLNVPLGKVIKSEPIEDPNLLALGFNVTETWELPDGSRVQVNAHPSKQGPPTYQAVQTGLLFPITGKSDR